MLSIFRRRFAQRGSAARYPEDPGTPAPTFRGMPALLADRCRGHAACAAVCPSRALEVERTVTGWIWELDRARCVACGLCAEACPEQAIVSSPAFELASRTRAALRLQVAIDARPAEAAR